MKKKLFIICLMIASAANAQAPTAQPPQPVEPILAPKTADPAVTPISPTQDDSIPTLNRVDPIAFNAKLGVGSSFGPDAFWMTADLEAQFDKFVGIGPKIQYGTNSSTDFFNASLGPRFIIPISFMEVGLNTGFGFAYRNTSGFEFLNFLFEAGLNVDVYLYKNLSVGLGYNINMISTAADTLMSVLVVTAGGHF